MTFTWICFLGLKKVKECKENRENDEGDGEMWISRERRENWQQGGEKKKKRKEKEEKWISNRGKIRKEKGMRGCNSNGNLLEINDFKNKTITNIY